MSETKGMIFWDHEQKKDGVKVTASILKEAVEVHEEEYYLILAVMSKMFDENNNVESIYVNVDVADGKLVIEDVYVKLYMKVDTSIFGNNGLSCKGD